MTQITPLCSYSVSHQPDRQNLKYTCTNGTGLALLIPLATIHYRGQPKSQLEASKQQDRDLCCHLPRAPGQVTLHTRFTRIRPSVKKCDC
eukprot:1145895-Pelagomonas_calceolata.AAC.1